MQSQLALNTTAADSLLIDNSKSYFTNVGYVRSSNFQMELRDVDPTNVANLGSTVTFVIPKAADLLGTVDLMVNMSDIKDETEAPSFWSSLPNDTYIGWVESLGYAMLEKVEFQVGYHPIETLTGNDLNLMNELMRGESSRHGFRQILKTGRPLVRGKIASDDTIDYTYDDDPSYESHDRLLGYKDRFGNVHVKDGKRLCIPLSLFFASHPSKYLPLAAIANCNDVRIVVKFRPWQELVMVHKMPATNMGTFSENKVSATVDISSLAFSSTTAFKAIESPQRSACSLRCQYVHLTGPEATALMGKEHVRIMKKWDQNRITAQKLIEHTKAGRPGVLDIDLNFLHPVQMVLITFHKVSELNSSSLDAQAAMLDSGARGPQGARCKNQFAYHGGRNDPNVENGAVTEDLSFGKATKLTASSNKITVDPGSGRPFADGQKVRVSCAAAGVGPFTDGTEYWVLSADDVSSGTQEFTLTADGTTAVGISTDVTSPLMNIAQVSAVGAVPHLELTNFKLTINGHTRHLDGKGLDVDYLVNRMMPAMHSNSSEIYAQQHKSAGHGDDGNHIMSDIEMLSQFKDRKDIFVYPFAMNPQSDNPSGHVNFSKVSQARLSIGYTAYCDSDVKGSVDYECQIIGLHYNWSALKDGRMLVSFA